MAKFFKKFEKEVKKAVKDAGTFVKNIVDDKHDNAQSCFKEMDKKGLKVCKSDNGQLVDLNYIYQNKISIGKIDVGENILEYCMRELGKVGFVDCSTIQHQDL